MIPAFFGLPLVGLGVAALKEGRRRTVALTIAVIVGLLGAAGSARGLMKLPALLSGEQLDRPAAVGVQSAMAIACLVYVLLGLVSLLAAGRRGGRPS